MSLEYNSISCCRVCLMTDCRLYDIHEYELADALWQISGTPVSRDELPQNLCEFCFVLLIKCSSFQDMCLHTQKLLKEEMDIDYIRRHQLPQQCLNLTQTDVEIIEITSEENVNYEPEEEMLIETLDEDAVIVETYMEDENKVGNKTDTSDDDMLIERLDEDYSDIETLGCETKISGVLKEAKNNKRKYATPKENEIKIGKACDKDVGKEKENKEKMKMLTIELKNNKIEFKVADDPNNIANDDFNYEQENVDYRRKGNKQDDRSGILQRINPYDNETFEKKYNVKIVTLGKEDQLEEIANRKKSWNYTESHFRCEDCRLGFNSQSTLNNHRAEHDPSIGPHSCEICCMRFKKHSHVLKHVNLRHRFKFICNECNFVSKERCQAKLHYEMHAGKTYDCQHCGKSFTKRSSYFTHVRLLHPEQNVVCDECGETFIRRRGLLKHKSKSHSVKFKCSSCPATFLSAEALDVHADTRDEHAELWPCELCGLNYTSQDGLMEHVEEEHPPRHCDECDITFLNPVAFETHVRRKHDGERPRQTPLKRKRQDPKRHQYFHKRKPTPCMCDQCGVTVQNSGMLVYHMRKHRGETPFACPHCPKAYVARYLLKSHLRVSHSGEKPHKCSECKLAFKWKGNLQRHYQVAHLGIRGSYLCPVCGRTSTTKGSMKVHLRAVHGDGGWPKRNRSTRKTETQDTIQSDSEYNDSISNVQSDSD